MQDDDVGVVWLPLGSISDGEFLHPEGDLQCRSHRRHLRGPRQRVASSGHQAAHARHRSVSALSLLFSLSFPLSPPCMQALRACWADGVTYERFHPCIAATAPGLSG